MRLLIVEEKIFVKQYNSDGSYYGNKKHHKNALYSKNCKT